MIDQNARRQALISDPFYGPIAAISGLRVATL